MNPDQPPEAFAQTCEHGRAGPHPTEAGEAGTRAMLAAPEVDPEPDEIAFLAEKATEAGASPDLEWIVVPNDNGPQFSTGYKWAIRRRTVPWINVGLFRSKEEADDVLAGARRGSEKPG